MGPTNIALVRLFQADQALRAAQARLDAAQKNVRVQERRVKDLSEKLDAATASLRGHQAEAGRLDLEIKSHDAQIERLREQQMTATNAKVYQTFLVEINTAKVDRGKVEDSAIVAMEAIEKGQAETVSLGAQLDAEKVKLEAMRSQIGTTVVKLQAEVSALEPARDAAADALPPTARATFERLAEHHEGEAMSAIAKPDRRREEYLCTACNMDLVTDVYNKLHSRDELVFCPSCRRILYIPADLPPELAVKKPKESKKKDPAPPEPKPGKDAWTEEEFFTRVDRAENTQLKSNQQSLLEALRRIHSFFARFDGQGAVNPAYNVYADGVDAYLLRINADGRIFAFWNALAESGQSEMADYFRSNLEPFVLDASQESEPLSSAARNLASTDVSGLIAALRGFAEKIAERLRRRPCRLIAGLSNPRRNDRIVVMQLAPEIVEQLLKLPKAERLELATRLTQDIEPAESEFDLDPLWVQEIEAHSRKWIPASIRQSSGRRRSRVFARSCQRGRWSESPNSF